MAAFLLLDQRKSAESLSAAYRNISPLPYNPYQEFRIINRRLCQAPLFLDELRTALQYSRARYSAFGTIIRVQRLYHYFRILDACGMAGGVFQIQGTDPKINRLMQFNDTQPIWLQIYDYACRAILAGRWTEQARIPSVRELAVTLEVNPNTVMRAYDKLETDGVIITRRGMGFFVTEGAQARTLTAQRNQFIRVELHALFVRMEELDIDMSDLQRQHENYLNQKNHENKQ